MASPVIFIFGLGYVRRAYGHMMTAAGWSVRGTIRRPKNFTAEHGAGWDLIPFRDQKNAGPCAHQMGSALPYPTVPQSLDEVYLSPSARNFHSRRRHV